ncbi:MAG: VanZ family protein [Bacteroidales bacterium]|nr:VanZ family protein [Bacteroidales bacterium]
MKKGQANKRNYRALWVVLFVIYMAGLAWVYFSSGEVSFELPKDLFGIPFDKVVHYSMFLPFPVLFTLALNFRSWWRTLSISALLAVAIAFLFETLQSRITETRVTDPADLNANVLGIATGLAVMVIAGLIARKR